MRISLSIRLLAFSLVMLAVPVASAAGIIFSIGISGMVSRTTPHECIVGNLR